MSGIPAKKNLVTEIFVEYKDLINHFYHYYNFLEMSIGQYNSIVLSIIEKIIKHFGKEADFSKNLREYINKYMFELIKEKLDDQNTFQTLIDSFIDKKFDRTNSVESSFKNVQLLIDFIGKFNIEIDPDKMIKMIDKNQALKMSLGNIYDRYENEIFNGKFFIINENALLNQMVEIYCMLENIEIQTNEVELFKDDADLPDSVKTYLTEIGNIPGLSEEEKRVLMYKISEGNEAAMHRYVSANLKLVVSVAKNYQGYGLPLLDLIQEGNIGLMTAVRHFDYNYGCKFSTYAMYWIKETIFRAVANTARAIRVPAYMHQKIISYSKTARIMAVELGRQPTMEEIAERMSLSVDEIRTLAALKESPLSLNAPISKDNPSLTLESSISSEDNMEEQIINDSISDSIRKLLSTAQLSERELEVIKLRFGIDCEKKTLTEIGKMYNVSKNRIYQIEKKVLIKLRSSSVLSELIDYVDDPDDAMEVITRAKRKSFYH